MRVFQQLFHGGSNVAPADGGAGIQIDGNDSPAGLQAACTAAERGHHVVLYEREAEPGGMLRLARRAPYCGELGAITDWLAGRAASGWESSWCSAPR